jgi:type IV secretory pathway VirB10-like protein
MAPPRQPPKTWEEVRERNNSLVTDFFKCGHPGRSKRRVTIASDQLEVCRAANSSAKKSKPPPSQTKSTNQSKTCNAASEATTVKPLVVPRRNYYVGDDKVILGNAVSEWFSESGRFLDSNGESQSLKQFTFVVGILYNTFQKYV